MPGAIEPVAVTGIGIRSPLGASAAAHWAGVVAGTRAVRRLTPDEVGGPLLETPGWTEWCGAPFADRRFSPSQSELCGIAAQTAAEACKQAGLLNLPPEMRGRIGVVFGASKPVLTPRFDAPPAEWVPEPGAFLPGYLLKNEMFNLSAAAEYIARLFDLQGPLLTPCAACATGLVSIIRGVTLIRSGDCEVVVAGSADSSLHAAYLAAYRRMGVLAPAGEDPGRSCRPFDAGRRGFAVGEGAATIVLEDIDHARRRGATILAEILGTGLTADNDSLVDVDPGGRSLARALRDALTRSGVRPDEVDAASLHGTGTRLNDLCETAAVKNVFGAHAGQISCFSVKGAIGHLMGAAGSVETATLIQAIQHQTVPPTVNLNEPDPDCDLDYTPGRPRPRRIRTAIKLSHGFGGACAALVLRPPASKQTTDKTDQRG